jgi:hypothetical protein
VDFLNVGFVERRVGVESGEGLLGGEAIAGHLRGLVFLPHRSAHQQELSEIDHFSSIFL